MAAASNQMHFLGDMMPNGYGVIPATARTSHTKGTKSESSAPDKLDRPHHGIDAAFRVVDQTHLVREPTTAQLKEMYPERCKASELKNILVNQAILGSYFDLKYIPSSSHIGFLSTQQVQQPPIATER